MNIIGVDKQDVIDLLTEEQKDEVREWQSATLQLASDFLANVSNGLRKRGDRPGLAQDLEAIESAMWDIWNKED